MLVGRLGVSKKNRTRITTFTPLLTSAKAKPTRAKATRDSTPRPQDLNGTNLDKQAHRHHGGTRTDGMIGTRTRPNLPDG